MKRARLIYNPTAGREMIARKLPQLIAVLEQAGYETSCHATTGRGYATREARIAAKRG